MQPSASGASSIWTHARPKGREAHRATHTHLPAPMSNYMSSYNLQSIQGPSDDMLRNNAVEGYTQVSRVGEVVINCFTDTVSAFLTPGVFLQYTRMHYLTPHCCCFFSVRVRGGPREVL